MNTQNKQPVMEKPISSLGQIVNTKQTRVHSIIAVVLILSSHVLFFTGILNLAATGFCLYTGSLVLIYITGYQKGYLAARVGIAKNLRWFVILLLVFEIIGTWEVTIGLFYTNIDLLWLVICINALVIGSHYVFWKSIRTGKEHARQDKYLGR